MLRMLTHHNNKSIMHIGKNGLRSTYIYFPDIQTYEFASDYHNLTISGYILDLTLLF